MNLPKRKQIRLQGYDYSQNGGYFITICTHNRKALLSTVGVGVPDDPQIKLSSIGITVERRLLEMENAYDYLTIDMYCMMPNHIHMIVFIDSTDNGLSRRPEGSSRTPTPTSALIPAFVSAFKRYINKDCGFQIWQRNYYEHIIRNDDDLNEIRKYIDENPLKWSFDRYYCG